ncbi:hypothetical protein HK096_000286 [Nowakowskiella sp. JEL0078]|nr:hypothetical protein HK096_000286 [Nowakowskiella sp. JEL0078]
MNLLKSLGTLVFGRSEDHEGAGLLQLPAGQLFYRNNKLELKNPLSCLFLNASATIRRTSSPFNYQLVISRVFEDGEELVNDDNEEDDERSFLLDDEIRFRLSGEAPGPFVLIWLDPEEETERCTYEFIVDQEINNFTIKAFQELIYNCMYERKHKILYTEASDEELEQYIQTVKGQTLVKEASNSNSYATTPRKGSPVRNSLTAQSTPSSIKSTLPMDISVPGTPTPLERTSKPSRKVEPHMNKQAKVEAVNGIPSGETVALVNAKLFLFDIRVAQFNLMHDSVQAALIQTEKFKFWLLIQEDDNTPYISQPIEQKMNPIFNHEHLSFVWVYFDEETGNPLYSWSLMFEDIGSFNLFKDTFGRCMYETANDELFSKIKQEDQQYILSAYQEDVEMSDAQSEEESVEDTEEEEEDSEEDDDEPVGSSARFENDENGTSKNNQLVIGFKNDRSFVSRGNKIGVFKHTANDELEHYTTINNVRTLDNKTFTPRKMMLHDQDSSMLLMNPTNNHSIFKMDLEYGKVVEEWKVDDDMQVEEIIPDMKYAQMTPQKTLIGMNHSALFRIDPRLSGKKRVDSESKQYTTKNKFSSAVTTGKGEIAVASEKGDIRLYDRLGIRAKTQLPGLGDPIIGIDSTESGKWIVATCKTYLLLINTEFTDEKSGKSHTGFQKSMGEKTKPVPKRLQLKPEHVAWMGTEVSFTTAHFNTGDNEDEKTIVTSTGPYVITWNFRRVKMGKYYDYQIKKYSDTVVADNFRFGQDKAIIVTLPENVEMVSRTVMSTPQKMMKKARDSIVNSPY